MKKLQKHILSALKLLIEFDIELIKNQPKEECINHRFAQHLETILKNNRLLEKYKINVDVEYNLYEESKKKSSAGKNIRPDIIAHKRKSGKRNNLLIIEAKKGYINKEDKDKIVYLVNSDKFKYSLGFGVAYLPNKDYMKIKFLLSNNIWEIYRLDKIKFKIKKTRR